MLLQEASKRGLQLDHEAAAAYIARLVKGANKLNADELDAVAAGRGGFIGIAIGASKGLGKDNS
jgi:hypothetical protein